MHTLDSWLAYRDFRLLWFGNFFGNTGMWLQLLSVGWLVKELSEGSGIGGLLVVSVGALNTLPGLIMNPLSGVLGDRLDRRKLVITVQSLGAILALSFAFLVASDLIRPWHAYAYVLISGSFLAISQPLQQVLISNTVPRAAIGNAYAINVLTVTGTRIFGPFAGGLLIAHWGFFWNFALEAALYLGVVIMFITLRTPYTTERAPDTAGRLSPLADFRDGLRHIWRDQREILQIMVVSVIPNTILHPVWFLLPLFTAQVLHAEVDMGGYLLAVTGAGGLISPLAIATFGFPSRKGYILLAAAALSSVSTMMFSHSSWLPAALIFLALMSMFQAHYRTTQGTVVLTIVPDRFRVRTMSVLNYERAFLTGTSILVGLLADYTSASIAILCLGGLGLLMSAFCAATLQRVRSLD